MARALRSTRTLERYPFPQALLSSNLYTGLLRRPWTPPADHSSSLITENERLRRELVRQRRLVEELRQMRAKVEAERRQQAEFLAHACHEVHVPVNGIIGMADLALQTEVTPEQREYLGLLKISADMLLSVAKDLLDLSRIEAGGLTLERTPFSLRDCLGDKMKVLALAAQRKDIELNCQIDPDIPDVLLGDPVRLGQVLVNLVGNAVKFTEQGGVLLQVRQISQGRGMVRLHFAVSDSGIGIRQERLGQIFAPFVQAEASTTRFYGGTGLGLAIAARLVAQMGATIQVESDPGEGSVFQFCLTLPLADTRGLVPAKPNFGGRLALVVEPHPVSRRSLVKLLRQWNFKVEEARDGREAMTALVRRRREQRPYHLVLLAEDLPQFNSQAVAARLQGRPELGVEQVVLLGAWLRRPQVHGDRHPHRLPPSDRRTNSLASPTSGSTLCRLSKPVKDMELLAALRGEVSPSAARAVQLPLQGIGKLQQLNILVVEDDPIGRQLAQHVLSRVGHRVATADSGPAALAAIAEGRFDLVLMDLQMPGMTGIDTTRAIRRREASTGRHLPVIALTARAMAEDGRRCLMAGMDACLIKPIQPVDLIRAIERLGQEHHLAAGLDLDVSGNRLPVAPPRAPVLQRESLLERVGNDRRLLSEVVALFQARTPELLRNGKAALARGDGDQFRYVVHTLAGMFRSLSAPVALEAAESLESEGAAGAGGIEGQECLEGGYARLEQEVARLKGELQELAEAA